MTPNEHQAGQRSRELHQSGLHCAEAVLLGVLETTEAGKNPLIPRMASCFGAGVGRTKEDLCGALAGGLMAVGCLMGRDQPGQPWDIAAETAAALRERFRTLYGSTRCSEILNAMGPQEKGHLCKKLSGTTAALVCRTLNELGQVPPSR